MEFTTGQRVKYRSITGDRKYLENNDYGVIVRKSPNTDSYLVDFIKGGTSSGGAWVGSRALTPVNDALTDVVASLKKQRDELQAKVDQLDAAITAVEGIHV